MSNVNIRKALALGIDRQGLIDNITHGNHIPAIGIVPPTIEGFEEDRNYFQDGNFDEAKEFLNTGLEELGLSDPSELTINLSINTSEAHSTIAQYVQEGWNQNLGIKDRKSTRLNSSHVSISYAVFCLKKKIKIR